MRIFGFDPSFCHFAWVIVDHLPERLDVIALGVIDTKPATAKETKESHFSQAADDLRRASEIAEGLLRANKHYCPEVIFTESPTGSQSSKAAKCLGISWGIVGAVSVATDMQVFDVTPARSKKDLCGKKTASDSEVRENIMSLFHFTSTARIALDKLRATQHEHVFDALCAVASLLHNSAYGAVCKVLEGKT